MANNCFAVFVKVLLLINCVLSVILGLVLLAGLTVGVFYTVNKTSSYSYIIILCLCYEEAVCLVVVSCLGVYAAHTENARYLKGFAILIFIQAMLSLSVRANINVTVDWSNMKTVLYEQMKDYQFDLSPNDNNRNHATKAWDKLQDGFSCCGVQAKYDWMRTSNGSSNESIMNPHLPKSCCTALVDGSNQDTCRLLDTNVHQTGCWQRMGKIYPMSFGKILGDFIGKLFLVAMALFLAQSYHRAKVVGEGHHHHQKPQDMEASL